MVHDDANADERAEKSPDLYGFAKHMAETLWELEGCDLDNCALQEILETHGIIAYRAPTAAELSDLEWWGHEFYDPQCPDHKIVGEMTAEFKALRPNVDRSGEAKSDAEA